MTIGDKIKKLRLEKGMTQDELGKAVGVQKAAINKYETGIVVNLKRDMISKLAKALDVNAVWLMDEEEDWPPMPSSRLLIQQIKQSEFEPANDEVRLLIRGMNKLSPQQLEQATNMMKIMFAEYAPYFDFEKENNDNDA